MPAQELFQPNPPPDASLLPKSLADLAVKLDLSVLSEQEVKDLQAFRRAADYIAAGVFLSFPVFRITLTSVPPVQQR